MGYPKQATNLGFEDDGFPKLLSVGFGFIYAIECAGPDGGRPIKVGFTAGNPLQRVSTIQTGCPYPVSLLGVLPKKAEEDEVRVLYYLADDLIRGEWFVRNQRMERLVARLVEYKAKKDLVRLEVQRCGSDVEVVSRKSPWIVYLKTKNVSDAQRFVIDAAGLSHEETIALAAIWRPANDQGHVPHFSLGRNLTWRTG